MAERPSIQQCRARRMFCIWSQRRAVGAEGWHAGAWVDESTTANLVEQTEASNDRPSAAHPHRSISTRSIFQRMPPCLAWGVTWPKCKVRLCPWTSWMGSKLSRVLSFVHHANRLSVCMYVGLSVWLGQSDADRINIFCTCATLMGLKGDVPASSSRSRSSEDQFSGLIISATS